MRGITLCDEPNRRLMIPGHRDRLALHLHVLASDSRFPLPRTFQFT